MEMMGSNQDMEAEPKSNRLDDDDDNDRSEEPLTSLQHTFCHFIQCCTILFFLSRLYRKFAHYNELIKSRQIFIDQLTQFFFVKIIMMLLVNSRTI